MGSRPSRFKRVGDENRRAARRLYNPPMTAASDRPHLLITSGGTRVPLDAVRWIGNRSTGRFGAAMVRRALERGAFVTHVHATDAVRPGEVRVDLDEADADAAVAAAADFWRRHRGRCRSEPFTTYADYRSVCARWLDPSQAPAEKGRQTPDAVILAAAVSDFDLIQQPADPADVADDTPAPRDTKLDSASLDRLRWRAQPLPKVIGLVRRWRPDVYLVGFKLLADADGRQLLEAGRGLARRHRLDLTVMNDQRTVAAGRHAVWLAGGDGQPVHVGPDDDPAGAVVDRVLADLAGRGGT